MTPTKVTFDSNVWQAVIFPHKYSSDSSFSSFIKINKYVREKIILGFLGEPIFTLEAIKKRDRQSYFQNYIPSFSVQEKIDGKEMKMSISFGPDNTSHPGSNPYIDYYLSEALDMGFRVLPCPRLAWIENPDFKTEWLLLLENINDYEDKFGKLIDEMTVNECGCYHLQIIGEQYQGSTKHWIDGLKLAPPSEEKNVAKALAEWADGDSIAAHYANGNDYFCTRDKAGNAGQNSVLSEKNKQWLQKKYALNFITPDDLVSQLNL
jgi:hypothetical protein